MADNSISFRLEIKRAWELAEVVSAIRNLGQVSKNSGVLRRIVADKVECQKLKHDINLVRKLLWPLITADVQVDAKIEGTNQP